MAYWWMGLFGSATPKRHLGISNSETVGRLDLGTLAVRRSKLSGGVKSSTTYISQAGRKSYKGTRFLKSTGSLA